MLNFWTYILVYQVNPILWETIFESKLNEYFIKTRLPHIDDKGITHCIIELALIMSFLFEQYLCFKDMNILVY